MNAALVINFFVSLEGGGSASPGCKKYNRKKNDSHSLLET